MRGLLLVTPLSLAAPATFLVNGWGDGMVSEAMHMGHHLADRDSACSGPRHGHDGGTMPHPSSLPCEGRHVPSPQGGSWMTEGRGRGSALLAWSPAVLTGLLGSGSLTGAVQWPATDVLLAAALLSVLFFALDLASDAAPSTQTPLLRER